VSSQRAVAPAPARTAVPFGRADEESLAAAAPAVEPAKPAASASAGMPTGWSRERGIEVAVKEGDTVSSLSRRYGVPVNVIAQAIGLQNRDTLRQGQTVLNPAMQRSGVAAATPAAHVQTAAATVMPNNGIPIPARAPEEQVATL